MENEQNKYWMREEFYQGILSLMTSLKNSSLSQDKTTETSDDHLFIDNEIETMVLEWEDKDKELDVKDDPEPRSVYVLSSQINALEELVTFMRESLDNELSKKHP